MSTRESLAPTAAETAEARERIDGLVHRTPLLSSRALSERCGASVWLKLESLQKTGSFKARGVFNKVLSLSPEERARGVITASAGNNGQAVAYVARHVGVPGYVVMPEAANRSKVSAVEEYGAAAILHGEVWDDAFARSLEIADEKGLTYVHPFRDPGIMAGQSTAASEILEELPEVDTVLVPIGGGGLITGMAAELARADRRARVVGVEPEGSANMKASRDAGRAVELDECATLADGLATKKTDPEVFRALDPLVDDYVTVSDDEMLDAIAFLLERTKQLAEMSGAATTAALLSGRLELAPDERVVAVVSGGNLDVRGKMSIRP